MSVCYQKCHRRFLLICPLYFSILFLPGCSSGVKPAKPNTRHENLVNGANFAPPVTPIPEITEFPATRREKVVDFGGANSKGPSSELLSASNRAKSQQQNSAGVPLDGRATIEINDENLRSFSEGAKVLVIESGSDSPTIPVVAIETWKKGVVDRKRELARSLALLKDRQNAESRLRESYYTEKDPVVREADIRPKWDEALALERANREELEILIEDFATFRDSISDSPELREWAEGLDPTILSCKEALGHVKNP